MTREEFAQAYATRSGTTVRQLHTRGLRVRPCDCGEEGCLGWKMVIPWPFHGDVEVKESPQRCH
jgi:hypothetical protein